MMTIQTLKDWSSASWDSVAQTAQHLSTRQSNRANDMRDAQGRLKTAWPSHCHVMTPQIEDARQKHDELSSQLDEARGVIEDSVSEIGKCRDYMNNGVAEANNNAGVIKYDEFGNCSLQRDFVRQATEAERQKARVLALTLTQKIRGPIYAAQQFDYQAALALFHLAGLDLPDASDGPLDLSDEGLRYQAELTNQGGYADCVSVATLMALGMHDPNFIREHMKWDPKSKEYVVKIYDHFGREKEVRVSMAEIESNKDLSGIPGGFTNGNRNATNPSYISVYEAAMKKEWGEDRVDKPVMTQTGIRRITGNHEIPRPNPSFESIEKNLNRNPPAVMVATSSPLRSDPTTADTNLHTVGNHAYAVKGFDSDGKIVMVNAWGPAGGYDTDKNYYPGELHLTEAEFKKQFGFVAIR